MTNQQRQDAGRRINPKTAEVWFEYGQVLDPYGEHKLTEEYYCVGRNFFAMDPIERVAVSFDDLDQDLVDALWAKRDEADREGWAALLPRL